MWRSMKKRDPISQGTEKLSDAIVHAPRIIALYDLDDLRLVHVYNAWLLLDGSVIYAAAAQSTTPRRRAP